MLTITAMLVFSFHSFAQDIPVEEEGEAIVIINQSLNGNGPGRDVVSVPIVATLFRTIHCIEVVFLYNIGEVTITMSNLTTGSLSTTLVDSQNGSIIIPISSVSGFLQITFQTEDSSSYVGYILL